MKRLLAYSFLASFVLATSVFAQEVTDETVPVPENPPLAKAAQPETRVIVRETQREQLPELNPSQVTPEFYLYQQELRRHDDPKQAIRRKAEARTAAREARIESMKWYGMSNARPQANPVPFMGSYSPTWIGSGSERYDWYGIGWPSVSLRLDQSYSVQR